MKRFLMSILVGSVSWGAASSGLLKIDWRNSYERVDVDSRSSGEILWRRLELESRRVQGIRPEKVRRALLAREALASRDWPSLAVPYCRTGVLEASEAVRAMEEWVRACRSCPAEAIALSVQAVRNAVSLQGVPKKDRERVVGMAIQGLQSAEAPSLSKGEALDWLWSEPVAARSLLRHNVEVGGVAGHRIEAFRRLGRKGGVPDSMALLRRGLEAERARMEGREKGRPGDEVAEQALAVLFAFRLEPSTAIAEELAALGKEVVQGERPIRGEVNSVNTQLVPPVRIQLGFLVGDFGDRDLERRLLRTSRCLWDQVSEMESALIEKGRISREERFSE